MAGVQARLNPGRPTQEIRRGDALFPEPEVDPDVHPHDRDPWPDRIG